MISTCGAPVPSSSASSSSFSSVSRMAPSPASSSTTSASSSTSIPSSTSIKIFRYSIIFSLLGCLVTLQRGEWVDKDSSAKLGEQITVQQKVECRQHYYSKNHLGQKSLQFHIYKVSKIIYIFLDCTVICVKTRRDFALFPVPNCDRQFSNFPCRVIWFD